MDNETQRMREIRKMPEYLGAFKQLKPVFDDILPANLLYDVMNGKAV